MIELNPYRQNGPARHVYAAFTSAVAPDLRLAAMVHRDGNQQLFWLNGLHSEKRNSAAGGVARRVRYGFHQLD